MTNREGIHRWLDRHVDVTVDRPRGSPLPGPDATPSPLNDGFVDGSFSGRGEPINAYVVGLGHAVDRAAGRVIAVVERLDDLEDRLVVQAEGPADWTETDVAVAVHHGERGFDAHVHLADGRHLAVADLRVCVKAIARDADGRVVLVRHGSGSGAHWSLPGGQQQPGESDVETLRRELGEELGTDATGLLIEPAAAWRRSCAWDTPTGRVHQLESIHLVDLGAESVDGVLTDAAAREGITEIRWWTTPEIAATTETVFPPDLARRLDVPPTTVPRHIRG